MTLTVEEVPFPTARTGLRQNCRVAHNVSLANWPGITLRPGMLKHTSSALTNVPDCLAPGAGGCLLVGAGTRLEAAPTYPMVFTAATGLSSSSYPWSFATVGTPSSTATYCSNGANTSRKWNGSAWSAPTCTVDGVAGKVMPKGRLYGVLPQSNRLAVASFSGATDGPNSGTSSTHHVYFSAAGDPETWTSTNYVQLTPGDGEDIVAMASWRDMLFVFKRTKFFVFSAPSTDASGNPVFNYREVRAGVGPSLAAGVLPMPDALYFLDPSYGLYATTGGDPRCVSNEVKGWFAGTGELSEQPPSMVHNSLTVTQGIELPVSPTASRLTRVDSAVVILSDFWSGTTPYGFFARAYYPGIGWATWVFPAGNYSLTPSCVGACRLTSFGVYSPAHYLAVKAGTTYHLAYLQPWTSQDNDLGAGAVYTIRGEVGLWLHNPASRTVRSLEVAVGLEASTAIRGGVYQADQPGTEVYQHVDGVTGGGYYRSQCRVNARGRDLYVGVYNQSGYLLDLPGNAIAVRWRSPRRPGSLVVQ